MPRAETNDPVIEKVRKLLRLATSPNPHEAASARQNADELMAKHSLSVDDVAEEVFEVIDSQATAERQNLAHIVTAAKNCILIVNKKSPAVAFRGSRKAVEKAKTLYWNLAREAEVHSQMSPEGNPPPAAREAWRICWWMGFLGAIADRLKPGREKLPPEVVAIIASQNTTPKDVMVAFETFNKLAGQLKDTVSDVKAVLERLRSAAYTSGKTIGERVSLGQSIFGALKGVK